MSQNFRARGVRALGNSLLLLLQVLDSLLAQYGTVENCEQGKTGSRDEGVYKDLDCISIRSSGKIQTEWCTGDNAGHLAPACSLLCGEPWDWAAVWQAVLVRLALNSDLPALAQCWN